MTMKKVMAILLCIAVTLTSFIVVTAQEPEITCTASATDVKMGEEFTVTVSISGYEPIRSGGIALEFDRSVLEYIEGEWLIDEGVKSFDPEKLNGVFMFFPLEPHDINGDLFQFTLKARKDAPKAGSFDITVTPQLTNANGENAAEGDSATLSVNISCAEHAYGDLIPEVPAKCGVEGRKAYYECSVCQKIFDTDKREVTEDQLIIPALNHVAGEDWQYDADNHWKLCANGCGAVMDKAAHSGGEATCKEQAVCSACGTKYGNLNADNHKNTEIRDAVEATCGADGYTGDTWCKDCNTKIADGKTIPATGNHTDDNGEWESDGTDHWHTCGACGTTFNKAAHSGGEANCHEKAVCSVCGAAYGELDPDNHSGGTEVRNAVEATCNTAGYTGDTYCLGCNTKIADGTTIPATGNHTDDNGEWESDGTDHWHTCGACGTTFDKAAHTGGEATCSAKAICSVCGAEYGELNPNNHSGGTEVRNAVEATCGADGYTGDTYCLGCNTKIADGTTIPATGNHTDDNGEWESDGTDHWHTCGVCATTFDKAAHTGGEATCSAKAICSVCGAQYGEIDPDNHVNTEIRDAVEATCSADGYTGDTWCKDCNAKIVEGEIIPATGKHVDADGEWETDGTNHWHTCSCGAVMDKAAHTGGEATCKDQAVCSVCGTKYGNLNADNHKNTEIRDAVAATEEKEGYTGDTWCKDCNTKIAEGTIIPKLDHTHDMVKTEAKSATHEEDGNIEYYTCSKCGKKYNDAVGTRELTDAEIVVKAVGHEYGEEWKSDPDSHWHACDCGAKSDEAAHEIELRNAKEATDAEKGYTGNKVCKICGYVVEAGADIPVKETIPQTGANSNPILWSALLGMSSITLAAAVVVGKKRKAHK